MSEFLSKPCTAFQETHLLARGKLVDVALAVKAAMEASPEAPLLTFDDATGDVVDLDLRGSSGDIVARLEDRAKAAKRTSAAPDQAEANAGNQAPARGRPKLGVVAREVTLLPRHWEWLASQPGGASPALRRLVDQARRGDGGRSDARAAQEAAYKFMAAMAGNFPGFEEATRALFAGDRPSFAERTAAWPADIRSYAERLMANGIAAPSSG